MAARSINEVPISFGGGGPEQNVFNDLATLSPVESEIFSRGVNTGYVRNWTRIGLRFDKPIGFRFGPMEQRQRSIMAR